MYLFERNKVGWIGLSVAKNDKHTQPVEIFVVIDQRIIQNVRLMSRFLRRYFHSITSVCKFPGEDFTEVHALVSLGVWSRILIIGRVVSVNSKIHPFSVWGGCKLKIFSIFEKDMKRKYVKEYILLILIIIVTQVSNQALSPSYQRAIHLSENIA